MIRITCLHLDKLCLSIWCTAKAKRSDFCVFLGKCMYAYIYIYLCIYLYKIWSMRFPALLPHNSDLTTHGQNLSYARSCWCPLKISQALLVCAVWNILPKQPYLSISVDQGHEEFGMVMVSRWIITAVSTDWRLFFKAEWISSTVNMRPKITKKLQSNWGNSKARDFPVLCSSAKGSHSLSQSPISSPVPLSNHNTGKTEHWNALQT